MESIRELYRIGHGPSSSHTMGPRSAAEHLLQQAPSFDRYEVSLYGSLASTGKGHLTDTAIREVFAAQQKEVEIFWYPDEEDPAHPNTLVIKSQDGSVSQAYYSVGGGKIVIAGEEEDPSSHPYPKEYTKMRPILEYCNVKESSLELSEFEGEEIFLHGRGTVAEEGSRGLHAEGVLPEAEVARKASRYYTKAKNMGRLLASAMRQQ